MAKRTTVQSSECQNIVYNLVSEKKKIITITKPFTCKDCGVDFSEACKNK